MKISLSNPARELQYINNFESGLLKKIQFGRYVGGEEVENLEINLAKFFNKKYCVTVNSGTDALLFSLIAVGVKKGDKVIVPSFTFFATVEVVMHLGAIPVFVDINPTSYTIDFDHLKSLINSSIKAIIPVHIFGNDAEVEKIKNICKPFEIKIVEDVAQAFGSKTISNIKLGTSGDLGAFSFFPSKTLGGIGDGGCVVTDNAKYYNLISKLRNHGLNKLLEHEIVGTNSRLDTLNSYVLNEKLKIFHKIKQSRNKFYEYYTTHLANVDWIKLPIKQNKNILFNYFSIQVPKEKRDSLLLHLNKNGIGAAIYYKKPIHLQEVVNKNYKKLHLVNTENVSNSILSLPFYSFPLESEIDYIIENILKFK